MNRRRLLEALGLGMLAPMLHGAMRVGQQEGAERDAEHEAEGSGIGSHPVGPDANHCANPSVRSTLDRARKLGKPTLVFVVPDDWKARWERQTAFGQLLIYCTDEGLLDLALCEVLCAGQADLAVHVPAVEKATDPIMILIEPEGSYRYLKEPLPWVIRARGYTRRNDAEYEEDVMARVQSLEVRMRELVAPSAAAVLRRAGVARRSLDQESLREIEAAIREGRALDPRAADEAGAIVRSLPMDDEHAEAMRVSMLSGTIDRLREGPPFGAHWATTLGCGSNVEPIPEGHPAAVDGAEPQRGMGISCGMARVPRISRRFLSFWSNPNGRD